MQTYTYELITGLLSIVALFFWIRAGGVVMTSDEMERQAFERWCINKCNYPLTRHDGSKSYVSFKTKMAWKAWKAAWNARARQESNDDNA